MVKFDHTDIYNTVSVLLTNPTSTCNSLTRVLAPVLCTQSRVKDLWLLHIAFGQAGRLHGTLITTFWSRRRIVFHLGHVHLRLTVLRHKRWVAMMGKGIGGFAVGVRGGIVAPRFGQESVEGGEGGD